MSYDSTAGYVDAFHVLFFLKSKIDTLDDKAEAELSFALLRSPDLRMCIKTSARFIYSFFD